MSSTKKFIHITREVFKIYMEIAPGLTAGILVTQIFLSLQGIVNAYIFSRLLDRLVSFVTQKSISLVELLPFVLMYAVVNFITLLFRATNDYLGGLLANLDTQKLRLKQTDFMYKLGMSQMENPELTNKVTRFVEVYTTMNQHLVISVGLVAIFISAVISGIVIFTFQPVLVILCLVLFLFKFVNNTRFRNKLWALSKDNTERRRKAWNSVGILAEPTSLKELIIAGGNLFLRKKFTDYADWHFNQFKAIRSKWSFFEIIQGILDSILYGLGIFLVVQKGVVGAISIGTITFYIRTIGSFSDQIDTLSYRIGRVAESSIRIQDALELFELYKPVEDGTQILPESENPPIIELKNVSFKYPSGKLPVIKNLSITIKPGEKVAIVGENGAGKTTLVKIITKIYEPQSGEVLVGGQLLKNVLAKSWYKKLGVLFQDFNTYGNLTVAENVGLGRISKGKYDRERVVSALKKADAFDFVNKYPDKLDQVLSERFKGGIRPSGGQWQKLAIARFFYRNAPVLILDEPTASIDAVAEANIFDNIYKFMKGKTVIIISHRFSTVRNADRIIVLDKGTITEDGTHAELLAQDGKYARSFRLQAKGYS